MFMEVRESMSTEGIFCKDLQKRIKIGKFLNLNRGLY